MSAKITGKNWVGSGVASPSPSFQPRLANWHPSRLPAPHPHHADKMMKRWLKETVPAPSTLGGDDLRTWPELVGKSETAIERTGDPNRLYVALIHADVKGRGYGEKLLRHITSLADKTGTELNLTAAAFEAGGLSQQRLEKWYKDHGFNEDWSGLVRKPHKIVRSITNKPAVHSMGGSAPWLDQPRDDIGRWTYK